jgi:LEA14-like dessication related protein
MNTKQNILILMTAFILTACSVFESIIKQTNVQKPTVEFTNAKISGLSFDKIDLLFDIKITNPNAVGINLSGFDYDLLINQNSFISGQQNDPLEIKAQGENVIQLPVSLKFLDIYNTYTDLKNNTESKYQIKCGLNFNLPVLGETRIPISKSGDIPLLQFPKIDVSSLKLDKLNLTGADLILDVKLTNPNSFSMLLDKFDYNFQVNGNQWIKGNATPKKSVAEKGENIIQIPISLNFLQMGSTLYQLISGGKNLNYQFTGDLNIKNNHPLLEQLNLPFNRSGKIDILK